MNCTQNVINDISMTKVIKDNFVLNDVVHLDLNLFLLSLQLSQKFPPDFFIKIFTKGSSIGAKCKLAMIVLQWYRIYDA
ncbi:MAG: hypothetical protein M9916_06305 [Crocinitomicaceae bacterium]|nr:hypothetical protein [Crocinitomicaceae bacterium]